MLFRLIAILLFIAAFIIQGAAVAVTEAWFSPLALVALGLAFFAASFVEWRTLPR
jgi:hypothetical protein